MHNWPPCKFSLSTSLIIQRKEKRNSDFAFGIFVLNFFILLADSTLFLAITDSSRPLYF